MTTKQNINKKPLILKYSIFFVIILSIHIVILYQEKNYKIDEYLEQKSIQTYFNYNALYNKYKKLSTIIFKTEINRNEVIEIFKDAHKSDTKNKAVLREKLYDKLILTYELLKQNNIKQLHFHLPNNESFLRFHRPNKYGDDLSGIRDSVEYVNKYKKPVNGFEEGRIFNGYRFVFPLFDKERVHIGSVEISFSSLAFHTEYLNDYHLASNFLILKEVVDKKVFDEEKGNYLRSPFQKFYFEKNVFEHLSSHIKEPNNNIGEKNISLIEERILKGKFISIYDNKNNTIKTYIPVFNPISNKVSAMYLSIDEADYILNKTNNFYFICVGIFIFLSLIFYFMYKSALSKAELKYLNKHLHQKVIDAVEDIRTKDKLLLQQSKNASMGEMIDAIAHQWKSPLNLIKMSQEMIKFDLEDKNIKDEEINEYTNKTISYVDHLVETLDEFRSFFRPNFKLEEVLLHDMVRSVLVLMKDELVKNQISVNYNHLDNIKANIIPNEFKHVLINLFSNAKDAFIENDIENRKVVFSAIEDDQKIIFKVSDNAGGIPKDLIGKIFEPHITTKGEGKGTGIGLHMTKQIIEKIGAQIDVENLDKGACFTITLLKENQ